MLLPEAGLWRRRGSDRPNAAAIDTGEPQDLLAEFLVSPCQARGPLEANVDVHEELQDCPDVFLTSLGPLVGPKDAGDLSEAWDLQVHEGDHLVFGHLGVRCEMPEDSPDVRGFYLLFCMGNSAAQIAGGRSDAHLDGEAMAWVEARGQVWLFYHRGSFLWEEI